MWSLHRIGDERRLVDGHCYKARPANAQHRSPYYFSLISLRVLFNTAFQAHSTNSKVKLFPISATKNGKFLVLFHSYIGQTDNVKPTSDMTSRISRKL